MLTIDELDKIAKVVAFATAWASNEKDEQLLDEVRTALGREYGAALRAERNNLSADSDQDSPLANSIASEIERENDK